MKHSFLFVTVFGALMLAACGEKLDRQTLATEIAAEIYTTLTASVPTVTPTPQPSSTPVIPPSPTPTVFLPPEASVRSDGLNVREGPAKEYNSISMLPRGAFIDVIGQLSNCSWLKVKTLDGTVGWVKGGPDYVDLSLDCLLIPHGIYRPPNGMFILDKRAKRGFGEFQVVNNTDLDAVIVIADIRNSPYIAFYIQAGRQYVLNGMPAGKFPLYFFNGQDWDSDERIFLKINFQKRFINLLDYLSASTYSMVLQTAAEDPAQTYDVTGKFPSLK
jgi:hypothetical protein